VTVCSSAMISGNCRIARLVSASKWSKKADAFVAGLVSQQHEEGNCPAYRSGVGVEELQPNSRQPASVDDGVSTVHFSSVGIVPRGASFAEFA
jgi:hypothetical protein